MANEISLNGSKIPAHLRPQMMTGTSSLDDLTNGMGGRSFPVLRLKGKVWSVDYPGEGTKPVMNDEGDVRSALNVILVKAFPTLSRNYYVGGYKEGDDSAPPVCWSTEGLAPDTSVPAAQRQASDCASCKMSKKGSKITSDGQQTVACQGFRRIIVSPSNKAEPMLLKLPFTSACNLRDYAAELKRCGVNDYSVVRTRIAFDPALAYPRVTFEAKGWLSEAEYDVLQQILEEPDVLDEMLRSTESTPAQEKTISLSAPPDYIKQAAPEKEEEPASGSKEMLEELNAATTIDDPDLASLFEDD